MPEITPAAGNGLTVTVTEFDLTQLFELVSVIVYMIVVVGLTEGFETVELKPAGALDHE